MPYLALYFSVPYKIIFMSRTVSTIKSYLDCYKLCTCMNNQLSKTGSSEPLVTRKLAQIKISFISKKQIKDLQVLEVFCKMHLFKWLAFVRSQYVHVFFLFVYTYTVSHSVYWRWRSSYQEWTVRIPFSGLTLSLFLPILVESQTVQTFFFII